MAHYLGVFAVFLAAYLLNVLYISVFFHRGLAHGAVVLSPALRRFVARSGCWVTGIDPKAWVCMHRLHHRYSDTDKDPHSPVQVGVLGLFRKQLGAYRRVLVGLIRSHGICTQTVADLDFSVSSIYSRGLWYLPYLVHLAVALALAL